MNKEFIFEVEQEDNMLVATCHDPEMATQGGTLDELLAMIRRFGSMPVLPKMMKRLHWPIRLHFCKTPVLSAQMA